MGKKFMLKLPFFNISDYFLKKSDYFLNTCDYLFKYNLLCFKSITKRYS